MGSRDWTQVLQGKCFLTGPFPGFQEQTPSFIAGWFRLCNKLQPIGRRILSILLFLPPPQFYLRPSFLESHQPYLPHINPLDSSVTLPATLASPTLSTSPSRLLATPAFPRLLKYVSVFVHTAPSCPHQVPVPVRHSAIVTSSGKSSW